MKKKTIKHTGFVTKTPLEFHVASNLKQTATFSNIIIKSGGLFGVCRMYLKQSTCHSQARWTRPTRRPPPRPRPTRGTGPPPPEPPPPRPPSPQVGPHFSKLKKCLYFSGCVFNFGLACELVCVGRKGDFWLCCWVFFFFFCLFVLLWKCLGFFVCFRICWNRRSFGCVWNWCMKRRFSVLY